MQKTLNLEALVHQRRDRIKCALDAKIAFSGNISSSRLPICMVFALRKSQNLAQEHESLLRHFDISLGDGKFNRVLALALHNEISNSDFVSGLKFLKAMSAHD